MKLFKVYSPFARYDGFLTVAADSKTQAKLFVEKYIRNEHLHVDSNERWAFSKGASPDKAEIIVDMQFIYEIGYATYNENAQNIDIIYRTYGDKEVICDTCIFDTYDY